MNNDLKIAIDGTAGSGKTTIAKLIAKQLNIKYINTGLYYRATTFLAMENSVIEDHEKTLELLKKASLKYINETTIELNGKVLTSEQLMKPEIAVNIHYVANNEGVREIIVSLLKGIVESERLLLMEGRDITTVIMEDCKNKFFITASPEIRAQRRIDQMKIVDYEFEEVLEFINQRDMLDMNRPVGALKVAEDAFEIDTSEMDIESTIKLIMSKLKV